MDGGDGGIRTLDRPLQAYNGLANRRLQPLGHVSNEADMPDAAASRKRPVLDWEIHPGTYRRRERSSVLFVQHLSVSPALAEQAVTVAEPGARTRPRQGNPNSTSAGCDLA